MFVEFGEIGFNISSKYQMFPYRKETKGCLKTYVAHMVIQIPCSHSVVCVLLFFSVMEKFLLKVVFVACIVGCFATMPPECK